jgi:MFS family permease
MRPAARRWLTVAALFTVTYCVSTPLAAYGVFLPILAESFDWSRGSVAGALSINLLLGGLAGFGVGALADRHGPRVMLALTVPLSGAGFALISAVAARWQLYLLVGVVGGIGLSSFYLLGASTIARWFPDRRGLPLALVLAGFNLGYITAGPVAASLIARVGWRIAYAMLGGACGVAALLAALIVRLPTAAEATALRRRTAVDAVPAGAARAPDGAIGVTLGEALVDPRQWYLNAAWLLLGGLTLMVSVHIVPFARDRGLDLSDASLALSAYGLGSVTGRLVAGAVSDLLGPIPTMRAAYAIQTLALLALWWLPSREALLACLVAFGIGFAASDTMVVQVVPDVFGVRAIGAVMGVLALGWRSGAALGPAAAGFLHDATGSYDVPFGTAPLAVLLSWVFFALATSRRRRFYNAADRQSR